MYVSGIYEAFQLCDNHFLTLQGFDKKIVGSWQDKKTRKYEGKVTQYSANSIVKISTTTVKPCYFELGYFESPLFWTIFRVPRDFKIVGCGCTCLYSQL